METLDTELEKYDHIKKSKEFMQETLKGGSLFYKHDSKLNIVDIDTSPSTHFRQMTDERDEALKPQNKKQNQLSATLDKQVNSRKYRPLSFKNIPESQLKEVKKKNYLHNIYFGQVENESSAYEFLKQISKNQEEKNNSSTNSINSDSKILGSQLKGNRKDDKKLRDSGKELERHEENMKQMNEIILSSEITEKSYLQKFGEKGKFSSVLAYNRRVEREKSQQETNKIIKEIKSRNKNINLSIFDPQEHSQIHHKPSEPQRTTKTVGTRTKIRPKSSIVGISTSKRKERNGNSLNMEEFRKLKTSFTMFRNKKTRKLGSGFGKKRNLKFRKRLIRSNRLNKSSKTTDISVHHISPLQRGIDALLYSDEANGFEPSSIAGIAGIGGFGIREKESDGEFGGISEIKHSTKKLKWLNSTKKKSYENYLVHLQSEKQITELELRKKKHENEICSIKNKLHEITNDKNHLLVKTKFLEDKNRDKDEQIKNYQYTIDVLTSKLQRMNDKEIKNERKLKLFQQYDPFFTELSQNFNFASPKDVIERMSRLEKNSKDSFTQLMDIQQQKNEVFRKYEKLKDSFGLKVREKVKELQETLEREQKKNYETKEHNAILIHKLETLNEYKKKYLDLHDVINNLWNKLSQRILNLNDHPHILTSKYNNNRTTTNRSSTTKTEGGKKGRKKKIEIFLPPDPSNLEEITSAIDNWIMAFTMSPEESAKSFHECSSTKQYQKFSQLASQLWIKNFKHLPKLKNDPLKVFSEIGERLRRELHKARLYKTKLDHVTKERDAFEFKNSQLQKLLKSKAAQEKMKTKKRPSTTNVSSRSHSGGNFGYNGIFKLTETKENKPETMIDGKRRKIKKKKVRPQTTISSFARKTFGEGQKFNVIQKTIFI